MTKCTRLPPYFVVGKLALNQALHSGFCLRNYFSPILQDKIRTEFEATGMLGVCGWQGSQGYAGELQ